MTSRAKHHAVAVHSATGLPALGDPRWRFAPRLSDGSLTPYLPFAQPFVPDSRSRLRWLRQATRLVLLADGYPARLKNGQVIIHPLDGRYLLEALLAEQAERPRRRLHASILRTSQAIVGRAETLGDALVMRYTDTASSMAGGESHISGLPQAYYATVLTRVAILLGDERLQRAADQFFAALLIPVSAGGVLYRNGPDTALALVPTRPRDLILNGWLSMLVSLHEYALLRDSEPARGLFAANTRTLRRMLPLYDVPGLRLSRYGLTGPLLLRIGFSDWVADETRVTDLRVAIPNEGQVRIPCRAGPRWTPRAYPEDAEARRTPMGRETLMPRGRGLRFVAILSRAAYPTPNRLRFRLTTPRRVTVTLTAHIGRYEPLASATVDREWIHLDARTMEAGSHEIDIELPYEPIDLFAYPTNFARGGPDEKVNTYHGTHIFRLRQMAEATSLPDLTEWADRWSAYVRGWADRPDLAGGVCRTPEGDLGEDARAAFRKTGRH
jgi:hypothetical protein